MNIQRILLPLEGDDIEQPAIDDAIELANQHGAELHVISVLDLTSSALSNESSNQEIQKALTQRQEFLENVKQQSHEAGVETVQHELIENVEPYKAIIDYENDHGVDLIVMPTHGRSGLNRLLIGSTTERVVRSASNPVNVVPISETQEE